MIVHRWCFAVAVRLLRLGFCTSTRSYRTKTEQATSYPHRLQVVQTTNSGMYEFTLLVHRRHWFLWFRTRKRVFLGFPLGQNQAPREVVWHRNARNTWSSLIRSFGCCSNGDLHQWAYERSRTFQPYIYMYVCVLLPYAPSEAIRLRLNFQIGW